jgi:hypothetical protein
MTVRDQDVLLYIGAVLTKNFIFAVPVSRNTKVGLLGFLMMCVHKRWLEPRKKSWLPRKISFGGKHVKIANFY